MFPKAYQCSKHHGLFWSFRSLYFKSKQAGITGQMLKFICHPDWRKGTREKKQKQKTWDKMQWQISSNSILQPKRKLKVQILPTRRITQSRLQTTKRNINKLQEWQILIWKDWKKETIITKKHWKGITGLAVDETTILQLSQRSAAFCYVISDRSLYQFDNNKLQHGQMSQFNWFYNKLVNWNFKLQKSRNFTWTAIMSGINIFPLSSELDPSINFLSTTIALLLLVATSTIPFTKFGTQVSPFGRTYITTGSNIFKNKTTKTSKSSTILGKVVQTFSSFSFLLHLPLFSTKITGTKESYKKQKWAATNWA